MSVLSSEEFSAMFNLYTIFVAGPFLPSYLGMAVNEKRNKSRVY